MKWVIKVVGCRYLHLKLALSEDIVHMGVDCLVSDFVVGDLLAGRQDDHCARILAEKSFYRMNDWHYMKNEDLHAGTTSSWRLFVAW